MKRVLYGGAFDLLHAGHIAAIKQAKTHGYLIVNVNSDYQVRAKKGKNRPVIPGVERAENVRALRDVDEVVYLPKARGIVLDQLLNLTNPDILIVNNEESEYNNYAYAECLKRGIEVIAQDRIVVGMDTTQTIKKIRRQE